MFVLQVSEMVAPVVVQVPLVTWVVSCQTQMALPASQVEFPVLWQTAVSQVVWMFPVAQVLLWSFVVAVSPQSPLVVSSQGSHPSF